VSKTDTNQTQWKGMLDTLKSKHKKIAEDLGEKSVAYLDLPLHLNVGDLLIYKGTESFFREYNVNVIYRFGSSRMINSKALSKSEVIIFHGGGNLGDIYLSHQKFREKLISKYKNKKIIILPQTIKFCDEYNFERARRIFKSHSDLTIYVRDEKSYKLAESLSDKVYLMPDMAHSLHPMKLGIEVGCCEAEYKRPQVLNMVRKDIESNKNNKSICDKESFDWGSLNSLSDHFYLKASAILTQIPVTNKFGIKVFDKLSDELVFKAKNYFDSHDVVYTDRLHGCILSVLLGKNINVQDNSYGKNYNYFDAWLKMYPYILHDSGALNFKSGSLYS
jgi:pyruvyl transferase EpsO